MYRTDSFGLRAKLKMAARGVLRMIMLGLGVRFSASFRPQRLSTSSVLRSVRVQMTVSPPRMDGVSTDEASVLSEIAAKAAAIPTDPRNIDSKGLGPIQRAALEWEAEKVAREIVEESCEVEAAEPICEDENRVKAAVGRLKRLITRTVNADKAIEADEDVMAFGEQLEAGWAKRGSGSSLARNVEVWRFGAAAAFKVLKANKMVDEMKRKEMNIAAAEFIRDGLVRLGPTFVKLGQVVSTRTDIFSPTYIDVLKTLQDDVPPFGGVRAKEIVARELGRSTDELFSDFSAEPLAAASLGQVHTATYNGSKVAIKVQRAGLKELFDVDLKNLKKLAVLLDKFDPKSDGADRDWVSIYDESARLLYLEIDYLNEARNLVRFKEDFKDTPWVRTPDVYWELTTPRVMTMEFVPSLKLTDIEQIESLGLDRKLLAKRTANSFLNQVIKTGYFHCDPHPGNLCVDSEGNLVYYDYGMMDELKPNVREGFRNLCFALFDGGPFIDDLELAKQAKVFVKALEQMGVLAKGADRLAVEKFGRFCIRAFKDVQLGKGTGNIKKTIGTDLQTLTEANVFRFPSTFTFIFRAFASIDGIGKGLDEAFDIGKLSQPFIEKFTDEVKYGDSEVTKVFSQFSSVTGLNSGDINTAVTQPRKIAYMEETIRSMEQGNLKIRVRSLENEKALERLALTQETTTSLLSGSILLNLGLAIAGRTRWAFFAGAALFITKALKSVASTKKFDKTLKKFQTTEFFDT